MRAYLKLEDSLTIIIDGETFTIYDNHPYYKEIVSIFEEGKKVSDEKLKEMIDLKETIKLYAGSSISIKEGKLVDKAGNVLHGSLVERILSLARDKQPVQYLVRFLENLYNNPSRSSIDELYLFLETNELPITEDGCFLAYKAVDENYKDYHTHTFDNSVGKTIEMRRCDVDDDRRKTCSYGFHAARYKYAKDFLNPGGHLMIVKINPADVVSVPYDYENAKLRTAKYTVVAEDTSTVDVLKETSVVDTSEEALLDAFEKLQDAVVDYFSG